MSDQFKEWYLKMYAQTGDENYCKAANGNQPKDLSHYLVEVSNEQ